MIVPQSLVVVLALPPHAHAVGKSSVERLIF